MFFVPLSDEESSNGMIFTKRYPYTLLLSFCLLCSGLMASPYAVFNHKVFYLPGEGPVVETYLDFHGKSVMMRLNKEGNVTGRVETTILFKQGDAIVTYDKKVLETPQMSPESIVDFLDVQRFRVDPGLYMVEVILLDLNDPEGIPVEFEVDLEVKDTPEGIFFSDISLIAAYKKTTEVNAYSKSGYDLLPMVSDDHAGSGLKELVLYTELYNTLEGLGEGEMFLYTSYLYDVNAGEKLEETQRFERKKAAEVLPIISKINIADIRAGDYKIVLEARDRENNLLSQQEHHFKRNFKDVPIDLKEITAEYLSRSWASVYDSKPELFDFIQSTRPISTQAERFALETTFEDYYVADLKQMQQYFLAFWEKRRPGDSETAWLEYKEHVDYVQDMYGTRNKRGYETDRGRVYLQYGPPDDITDRANEPSSYPYELWRYYKADRWNNVRFVFFDPQLTGRDYELLHCEGILGEIRNPQWRLLLEQRNTPMNNVDRQMGNPHFGGRVDEFFDNPR